MDTLWGALWRKWLDPGGLPGVERLCPHLLRDIGLTDGRYEPPAPEPIRDRNLSDPRTFCRLQAYH